MLPKEPRELPGTDARAGPAATLLALEAHSLATSNHKKPYLTFSFPLLFPKARGWGRIGKERGGESRPGLHSSTPNLLKLVV